MNNEHLMKFRLRQMEKETKSTIKKKKTLLNLIGNLYKSIVVGNRSNHIIKGKIGHDYLELLYFHSRLDAN